MKLNLRSVDLNLLPVFVAIVEERQLSRAALRLGMSQPAVSAALQRLRLTLDDPLFTRSRVGLHPTPRATEFYLTVSAALDTVAQALGGSGEFDPSTAARQFRVIGADYYESLMLGSLLARLRQQGPRLGVKIEMPVDGWTQRLILAEVDVALDSQMPEDDRLRAEVVGYEALSVVAREGHPAICGELTLEEFLDAEHVVLPLRESRVLPLDQLLGRPGWRRRVGAQVSQFTNLLSVASQTDLIATVPLRLAQRMAPHLSLQVLPFPIETPPIPIYAIWPKALERDAGHAWFIAMLKESFVDFS